MATAAAAAAAVGAGEATKLGEPPSVESLRKNVGPPRIVVTEGFERLFSHYTGLQGDELLEYLQDFQAKALKVVSLIASLI